MGKRFPFRSTNNYTAFHAERRFFREREWKICSRSEKSERIASMRHVNILFVTLWLKIFCVRKRALGISVAWCGVKIQFPPTSFTPKWQIELRRFFLAAQLRHGNCWDAYRFLWCPSRLLRRWKLWKWLWPLFNRLLSNNFYCFAELFSFNHL